MNYKADIRILGHILMIMAGLMLGPLLVSVSYGEDWRPFGASIMFMGIMGVSMGSVKGEEDRLKIIDGMFIVTMGWVISSLLGALPFVFSGVLPNYVDALFEIVSGFTTAGSTVLKEIESVPKGLLFWRSFAHWIGGMGILIFALAFLPKIHPGSNQIYRAESPGPDAQKITPRMKDTAAFLYGAYILITLLEAALLMLGGMSVFDSFIHTFGTVGTGGFSSKNLSIGYYNSTYIQMVIAIFMVLSGTNFTLYFYLYRHRWRKFMHNEELHMYLGIILVSTLAIAWNIVGSGTYSSISLALRDAFFQVSSIITTTGYTTANYELWPYFSQMILFILMFIGGCAGSTGGAIKNVRILVLFKVIRREISKLFHPQAVVPIKLENRPIPDNMVLGVVSFVSLYVFIFIGSTLLITLDNVDLITAMGSVAATIGDVGPAFGRSGPMGNYSFFSNGSKLLLSFCMLAGRLELYTVIALIVPLQWRKS